MNMRNVFTELEWLSLAREFGFTPNELEVAKALFDNKNPDEIAFEVGISREVASASLGQLFSKTGTSSPISFALGLYARLRTLEGQSDSGPIEM